MRKRIATLMALGFAVMSPLTVFAAPETMPDGTVFDAEYYAQQNQDVVAALGTDTNLLYQHYVTCGKNEGRLPCAPTAATGTTMTLADGTLFDPVYYAQSNPDVVAVFGTDANLLAQHYMQSGKAEGRKPVGTSAQLAPQQSQSQMIEAIDLEYARWHKYLRLLYNGDNGGDYEVGLREDYYLDRYEWMPDGTIIIDEAGYHVVKDPALFFERKDYSSNTLYQKVRNEMISLLTKRTEMNNKVLSVQFQTNNNSRKEVINMLENLSIDLMKMGYADYIFLEFNIADGTLRWDPTSYWGAVVVSSVVYDYHDIQGFGGMTNAQIDKDILTKHPELAEVLSRMQKN